MPCLNLSTNVNLDGIDTSAILSEATSVVAKLIGKPEAGSVPMAFGGTEEPAAYGEIVSIGGLNADVNKKLSAAVADILSSKLSVPKSRFFLKFFDAKASYSHLQRRVEKHPPTICYPSHLKIFFHLIESKRHPYLVGFNHPSNQHGGGKSQCPYSEKGDAQPETLLTHFNIFTPKGGIDGLSSLKIRGPITCAITRSIENAAKFMALQIGALALDFSDVLLGVNVQD
ncbi:macrophage migration inhibitory factor homolog isoform X2 [Tanacetum coccineum]